MSKLCYFILKLKSIMAIKAIRAIWEILTIMNLNYQHYRIYQPLSDGLVFLLIHITLKTQHSVSNLCYFIVKLKEEKNIANC